MKIYVSMVADLFHYGHMKFLRNCKNLENDVFLVVGLHSDEVCTNYKRKPIMTLDERATAVESFGLADQIIRGAPLNPPKDFLVSNEFDLVIHAHPEEEDEKYRQFFDAANDLGIFKRIDYNSGISTSELINRIKNSK